jgi:hypothetical protein
MLYVGLVDGPTAAPALGVKTAVSASGEFAAENTLWHVTWTLWFVVWTATAEHPLMGWPAAWKLTVPCGGARAVLEVTVADKVVG